MAQSTPISFPAVVFRVTIRAHDVLRSSDDRMPTLFMKTTRKRKTATRHSARVRRQKEEKRRKKAEEDAQKRVSKKKRKAERARVKKKIDKD